MLIKDDGSKINFIDKYDNYVGYDNYPQCCEEFGWYISDTMTTTDDDTDFPVEGFYFDTSIQPVDVEDNFNSGWCLAFTLINENGENLYLHLFNHHNGYYSHGWESNFSEGGYL